MNDIEVIAQNDDIIVIDVGTPGLPGATGAGLPIGGAKSDVVIKNSGDDYDYTIIPGRPLTYHLDAQTPDLENGTITDLTSTVITDASKVWIDDEWADTIVRFSNAMEEVQYARVLSNNANTFTIESDVEPFFAVGDTYQFIKTYNIPLMQFGVIGMCDVRNGFIGILLPEIQSDDDRSWLYALVEKANNGTYALAIVSSGLSSISGNVYATLEHKGEGGQISAEYEVDTPHFDILFTEGISRYAVYKSINTITIDQLDWQFASPIGTATMQTAKRFLAVEEDGQGWLKCLTIHERTYKAVFNALITRISGSGELTLSIAIKRNGSDTVEYIEDITSKTRFSNQLSETSISLQIPIELSRYDKIIPICKVSSGICTVDPGSTLFIQEL